MKAFINSSYYESRPRRAFSHLSLLSSDWPERFCLHQQVSIRRVEQSGRPYGSAKPVLDFTIVALGSTSSSPHMKHRSGCRFHGPSCSKPTVCPLPAAIRARIVSGAMFRLKNLAEPSAKQT